jgi:hypothetical protein
MFSRHVEHVSATKIFARALDDGRQALIYAMQLAAREPLAMVLPLPVPPAPPENAVEFIDLSGYSTLFDDMKRAFPMLVIGPQELGRQKSRSVFRSKVLEVHEVGAFAASFVPTPRDFARLDPRFQLAPGVLAALPAYADWGFAVFQLDKAKKKVGIHPMALRFPRREPGSVFFPTVHVHDGSVPVEAHFDHALFAQLPPIFDALLAWTPSTAELGRDVDAGRTRGLVDATRAGWAHAIYGNEPNRDVWLRAPTDVTADDIRGRGANYAYEIRATYHLATESHHQYPRWLDTASKRLARLCAGVRTGLVELTAQNARRWQLGPLHDGLPPHFMNGPMLSGGTSYMAAAPVAKSGPVRVQFSTFSDYVEPQRITLGFTEVPSQEDATDIDRALRRMLDAAVS